MRTIKFQYTISLTDLTIILTKSKLKLKKKLKQSGKFSTTNFHRSKNDLSTIANIKISFYILYSNLYYIYPRLQEIDSKEKYLTLLRFL